MRRTTLVAATASALALATPASAHVIASPTFLASGRAETIELSVPNERDAPMTGFVVTVPAALEIVEAKDAEGWNAALEGRRASWSGGSLPAKLSETFGLQVVASGAPGAVELEAEQRYADGGKVRWPVALTIVPGSSTVVVSASSSDSAKLVVLLVALGLLITGAITAVAWHRRAG